VSRLESTFTLVAIASESRYESAIAAEVERSLRSNPTLDVERIGDNVVARTTGLHSTRLLVAGHLDTVPGDVTRAVLESDRVTGLGACDMKGSLAVMLELASESTARSVELTWVFYAREEISRSESGLLELAELRPELLQADAVVLAEPTGGCVEVGCQGTLRALVTLRGKRAHTARPFTGRNAIHRLSGVLERVSAYEPREAVIDGVTFTEQLQAVAVEGGVAANVVPDLAQCTLNHRVAPDRSREEASAWLQDYLGDALDAGDSLEVVDWAPPAPPAMSNERLGDLARRTGRSVRAKVGWTDVATFAALGIPAANFGAGDPLLAHRSDEFVTSGELDEFAGVLAEWLS
jgi:succinyl-diaminopimelate desuccinylase